MGRVFRRGNHYYVEVGHAMHMHKDLVLLRHCASGTVVAFFPFQLNLSFHELVGEDYINWWVENG